jgi:hypothetical protein
VTAGRSTTLRGMSQVNEKAFGDDEYENDNLFGDESEFDDPDEDEDDDDDFDDED